MKGRAFQKLRILLLFLGLAALTMMIPPVMAAAAGERDMLGPFLIPALPVLSASLLLFFTGRRRAPAASGETPQGSFNASDGFLLVFLAWALICLMGALPYYLSGRLPRFSDAVFESVSGFSTTGLTVISDVESLPRSLLLWRGMTHWLGGMGIVLLTAALFPLLGLGGFQMVKAETPGPEKDRIAPKITASAKILWMIYVALTALQTLLLRLGGMGWFDAVFHAFSTMATGGFSSRNDGIGFYRSPWIDWICILFMLLAGFNFSLLYRLLQGKCRDVFTNSEARAYGAIILLAALIVACSLALPESGFPVPDALRLAFFHTASIMTSTGFSIDNHNLWPALAKAALFLLFLAGGCSGSTAGGVKVIRHVVLWKQMRNEMRRLLYPKGVFSIQLNDKAGRKDVVYGVAAFVFVYALIAAAAALLVSTAGVDLFSSLVAALISLGNIGLGIGRFGPGAVFYDLPGYVKWGLSLVMIAGRLELWTVLVFFSPAYWRR
ncbi:MAG: TrkH family potassium uptake protein [Treponema sp.]|jgi:trk system potassium uptake protein TrkH|nr:TrkH family potassium uptake protein [Treponema sp.]